MGDAGIGEVLLAIPWASAGGVGFIASRFAGVIVPDELLVAPGLNNPLTVSSSPTMFSILSYNFVTSIIHLCFAFAYVARRVHAVMVH